jgi:hypothetical protein
LPGTATSWLTIAMARGRGAEDHVSGGISEAFSTRRSAESEAELQTVDAERARLDRTHAPALVTAEKILEVAQWAGIVSKSRFQRACAASVESVHDRICELARQGYAEQGRGCVLISYESKVNDRFAQLEMRSHRPQAVVELCATPLSAPSAQRVEE